MDVDNNTIILPILEYKMAHDANIIHSKGINTGSMTVARYSERVLQNRLHYKIRITWILRRV
jgi:hypothetical protein